MNGNEQQLKTPEPLRVIISGGGTGGHIFPAISIANEIRKRFADAKILFVGAENRMEMERVPRAGYEIIGLPVMGLDRRRPWRNFKVLAHLWTSMRRARRVVRDFHPDIAVGVGGYAAGPTLKAAQKAGVPTLLQEQNSYAGVTNKLLAKKADAICVAYENMGRFFPSEKIILTGNPVREAILECPVSKVEAKKQLGFDPGRPLLLVSGGSLGSRSINEAVALSLSAFSENDISVLWQTGKFYADACIPKAGNYENVHAQAFIDDMAIAYRAADLVVARAGASTITELQLLGMAAVLVPSPNVAEDHQRKNALALVDNNAAVMIDDVEVSAHLAETVVNLLGDPKRLDDMSKNISKMALRNAAAAIVDQICSITGRHTP